MVHVILHGLHTVNVYVAGMPCCEYVLCMGNVHDSSRGVVVACLLLRL